MLEDLRNLARPIPLERFPVDVNRSVKDTLDSMQALATSAGLVLDGRFCAQTVFVDGDVFALGRVYRNLIVNAIEATSPGGTVTVSTETTGGHVRISVQDTGVGIPRERLGAIFEDFNTTKRRGLGLGLAISRKNRRATGWQDRGRERGRRRHDLHDGVPENGESAVSDSR